jgi:hypothetical protein
MPARVVRNEFHILVLLIYIVGKAALSMNVHEKITGFVEPRRPVRPGEVTLQSCRNRQAATRPARI